MQSSQENQPSDVAPAERRRAMKITQLSLFDDVPAKEYDTAEGDESGRVG